MRMSQTPETPSHNKSSESTGSSETRDRQRPQASLREDLAAMEHAHPADAADHLEGLNLDEQVRLVAAMPVEEVAQSLEEMEDHARTELITQLQPELVADILEEMAPDEAADVLDNLDEVLREQLLKHHVESQDALALTELMRFDPDTAGGVMNTEIVILDKGLSADQAIKIMRREIVDKEIPYYAYLVDEESSEELVGVVSLRDMLTARPGQLVKNLIKHQQLVTVLHDVDKEEVAHQLTRYNFLALPVVDYDGRLLGVVTHDDVMDIIQDEASEDMLGMVGAGGDETVDTPWRRSVKMRLPWLVINLGNSALAAYVVHLFEGPIAQMAILAALMHIVSNQAGNTGHQALAVMIRQLAQETYDRKKSWGAVGRELRIGLANGLILGTFVFLVTLAVTQKLLLAQVMGLALGANMIIGAVSGSSIPLILKECGRDPALASSIFLTTLTDCAGFFIFLGLAVMMLF